MNENLKPKIEAAEQTAYWMYDNLLTLLLHLGRPSLTDQKALLDKVCEQHADLGKLLTELKNEL